MNLSMEMTHSAPMMYSAVFSPDDHYILTGSLDKNLRLWSFAQGRELKIFKGHSNYISSVEFSPDGKNVVSSSWDKTIKIWDIETGKEIRTLIGHAKVGGNPTHIAVSPDGKTLLVGTQDLGSSASIQAFGWQLLTFFEHFSHRILGNPLKFPL